MTSCGWRLTRVTSTPAGFHPPDDVRLDASSLVGKGRVGTSQFNRRHFKSSKGNRWVSFDFLVQAHAVCKISDAAVANSFCDLHGSRVKRFLKRSTKCYETAITAFKIVGLVGHTAIAESSRRVHDRGQWRDDVVVNRRES